MDISLEYYYINFCKSFKNKQFQLKYLHYSVVDFNYYFSYYFLDPSCEIELITFMLTCLLKRGINIAQHYFVSYTFNNTYSKQRYNFVETKLHISQKS